MIVSMFGLILIFSSVLYSAVYGNPKYQRIFINARAINFVDTTKHGFRIVLLNSFLDAHLSPTQIPTLFVSAIPLKSGEPLISKVFYPDSIREDKQVYLSDLRERSWYYVCIEWENFNRHNETTGTDCRLLRTLDRFGKSADTTVEDVEVVDITATTMQFKIRSITNFPMRFSFLLHPFERNFSGCY
uniref:DUF4793 domain-containing protein n=1 Tax=Elaeophora elaphi TaxID=1147741 RepID=A0A0R3RH00_9BILA